MAASTLKHALYPDESITMALFRDVENSEELRQCVMKGDFEATLLKPTMILDPFQVTVAANKAVHLKRCNKMVTKNVHTEILFSLSPSKSISDSFKRFGLGDSDTAVYVVIVNDDAGKILERLVRKVTGYQVDVSQVKELSDLKMVKKVYKLTDTELAISSPLDSVITRIAAKEVAVV